MASKGSLAALAFASVVVGGSAISVLGCSRPAGLPLPPVVGAPAPPPTEPVAAPVYADVWTSRPGVTLRTLDGVISLPLRPFARLEVVSVDSLEMRVRCGSCVPFVEGYLRAADVVQTPFPPEVAAWGSLGDFALAIRNAVTALDLPLLRPVMAEDFSYSFFSVQNPDAAFLAWESQDFTTLARVPDLLDQGLSTRDSVIWSAPPIYDEDATYRGLRLGFKRRADGRWEWLYLISGLNP